MLLGAAGLVAGASPASAASSDLCAQTGYDAGFRGDGLVTAVAVALAESSCNPSATNVQNNTPPSRDRGLWQINDYWHPEVDDACAYDAQCNANAAFEISAGVRTGSPGPRTPRARTGGTWTRPGRPWTGSVTTNRDRVR